MATKAATASVDDHNHGGSHPAGNQIKHFDSLRNTLKNAKHSSGHDLYQHLVDVMNHIVTHCPDNGIDKFEEISYLLKLQRDGKIKSLSDFLLVSEERGYSTPGKAIHGDTEKYLAKAKKMFDVSLSHPLNFSSNRLRKNPLRVPPKVMRPQLKVETLAPSTTCQTFLPTPEFTNGEASVSVTMRPCSWPSP